MRFGRTGVAVTYSARVRLEGGLSERAAPLLSALGIEATNSEERGGPTLLVEPIGPPRAGAASQRVRLYRPGEDEAQEFEARNEYAVASAILSHALGLSSPLLTADERMFGVIRAAVRTAQADSPIVLTGETGTGKELFVRMIHAASERNGGMFSVNCAALNDSLAADAKSLAARDASGGAIGVDALFAAHDTTLFLDQVTELSHASQSWVLHALIRAAETATTPAARPGARLISATNRALEPLVASEEFRHELYDRLAVLTFVLPPLRERPADITLLAAHFLRTAAPHLSLTLGAFRALTSYPFPGNVRELHNLVTRLAIAPRGVASRVIHASEVRAGLAADTPASVWMASPFRMRRELALQALSACKGDRVAAARKLGISVRALQQHVVATRGAPQQRGR
jgi:DNA-binding NtrC family response regulator